MVHAERRTNGHTNRQTDGEAEMRKVTGVFATTQTRVKNECVERSHGRAL